MTMTNDRLREILEIYGTNAEGWPAHERAGCRSLLANDADARIMFQQFISLNRLLDTTRVPEFPSLKNRVLLQALPPRVRPYIDCVLDWLIPAKPFGPQVWRPVMAACLPLVFGILVGNYFSFGVTVENQGFEYWDDELYMLSLNDYTENL